MKKARFASKEQFEKRFQRRLMCTEYQPGDLVLVRNTPIETSHDRKVHPQYLGPYQIMQKGHGKSYILQEMDGTVMKQSIATYRLMPYTTCNHEFMKNNKHMRERADQDQSGGSTSMENDKSTDTENGDSESGSELDT